MQTPHKKIIRSRFKPAWWCRHRHLQTLFPALLRKRSSIETRQEQFELPDGDFIDLAWTINTTTNNAPIVIILHGLEGSIHSPYATGLLNQFAQHQWTGVLMHFRGCSGRHNRLDRSYHSGDTGDIHALVTELNKRFPDRPLAAIGISLGGNALLKYLGEQQDQCLLDAAMAVSVPFDLADGAHALNKGFSRLYQWHLISHIRNKMKDKFKDRPAPINMDQIDTWRDFFSFDDNVTAPIHGFNGVDDYYSRSSSKQFLKHIKTPTLLLHSKDDPFMSESAIPTEESLSETVTFELTEQGGHVGFIYSTNHLCPGYWIEKRVIEYFSEKLLQQTSIAKD